MDTNGYQNHLWKTLRYLMCFWNGNSRERPYHYWADSSGEWVTRKVSNHSHFTFNRSSIWAPMATKNIFERPYGTLCAFEMATPPSDHIIIGLDSSGERATRKVSNHSHFTLCGGGLSSLVRVIMMSWGWISPRSVLLHTIYTMANPNTVLWGLGVSKRVTNTYWLTVLFLYIE